MSRERSEWQANAEMQPRVIPAWQRDPIRNLTDRQRHEHAKQAAAMRAGQLRRLPTVFGELL